ncbi:26S proteasome subunit P45 family protein [Colletotrichum acutatum]
MPGQQPQNTDQAEAGIFLDDGSRAKRQSFGGHRDRALVGAEPCLPLRQKAAVGATSPTSIHQPTQPSKLETQTRSPTTTPPPFRTAAIPFPRRDQGSSPFLFNFPQPEMSSDDERQKALDSYRAKLLESREWEAKLKSLRLEIKDLQREFDRTEDNIKALQSVGQIIGEVLKQLDDERFIVKASSGPRYVVGCRSKVDKVKLKQGTRVALDMTTLTIMRMLPREVDPLVYNMSLEDPGQVSFAGIGGLNDQIRELREVIELPLKNPELFLRVGIKPPKGVLLYGPPGTGKTLLARAVASSLETNFLKVVSSAIVDKYIGESARLIREMFGYAKEHEPCIIFMDEIDAIGGRRFSEGTSADREIQRTLMELLNQLDGFDYLGKTKIIMATNRPDTLDPALLRAGRLDRKIEIALPNEVGRLEILKIHAQGVVTEGEIDFESVVKMSDGLNGADLRNVVTEAGLFAIKDYRDAINQDDFNKAVRKVAESKKLEGKLEYQKL